MGAGSYDFGKPPDTIEQGSEVDRTITPDQDFSDHLARMQVREWWTAEAKVLDLSTATSGLSWVSTALRLLIPATTMAGVSRGDYVYDLELVPPDGHGGWDEPGAFKLLRGKFIVQPEATR